MKTYRIRPLPLMKMELDKGRFTYLQNYGTRIWVPIFCWFIEGADRNILVDSGASAEDALKYTGNRAENIMSFEEALASIGLKAEDIDVVIQTHLHWDHCANTPKCKNATVLVSEDELKIARSPHPFMSGPYKKELLSGINFTAVKSPYEVAPGIELFSAAGHTAGTLAVAVNTEKGKAVIAGFCGLRENFEPPEEIRKAMPVIPPGIHLSAIDAYESALRVKEMGDILIPMHDPDLLDVKSIP